jgi:hypothetical protein
MKLALDLPNPCIETIQTCLLDVLVAEPDQTDQRRTFYYTRSALIDFFIPEGRATRIIGSTGVGFNQQSSLIDAKTRTV